MFGPCNLFGSADVTILARTKGSHGNFASWLEMTMDNKGLNNKALADLVGVSESVTSRWRSGRSLPSMQNCERLAAALGVDPLRLGVTAGVLDGSRYHVEPLPTPEPYAGRAHLRSHLEKHRGLTEASIEAMLEAWDREMGLQR